MSVSVIVKGSFEAAHRLMSHPGHCRNIHGHSYKLEVELRNYSSNEVNENEMVVDFSDAKEALAKVLYLLDHAIILEKRDPLISVLISEELQEKTGQVMRVEILSKSPTAEVLASEILTRLQSKLPFPVRVTRVRLWETENNSAEITK